MVTHFLQTLFSRTNVAAATPGSSAPMVQADEADYAAYIAPPVPQGTATNPAFGSDPAMRRSLVHMWMHSLPILVRPIRLVHDHEQIAFTIALNWGRLRDLKRYMEQLIFCDEQTHTVFSGEVFQELLTLERFLDDVDQVGRRVEPLLRSLARA